jgi:methylthioribose-1-phosphate isomerase
VPRLRGFGLRAALTFFWRKNGDLIPIEEREPAEVVCFAGHQLGPEGVAAFNPAFDITPAKYISAIITEKGVLKSPYRGSIRDLFGAQL